MRLMLVLVLVGCMSSSDPIEPQVTSGVITARIPITVDRRFDVLFVIDSSPAMAPYVDNMRVNLRRFVDVLREYPGGLPDLHLGVVTTDVLASDAKLRGAPGLSGDFVVDRVADDGTRQRNYAGDLADVLASMTDVGTNGGTAQPLAAARRAFENPANDGFLRDDAYTAIYFISASDAPDEAVDGYVQFFKALHHDPAKLIVGGALKYEPGTTHRLWEFLDQFPSRNPRTLIGDADWSSLFVRMTELYKTTLGAPCVEGPLLDVDPAPGRQYACAVWYDFPIGGEVIPPCGETLTGSCWSLREERATCPEAEGILRIERPRADLPVGTMLNLECLSR